LASELEAVWSSSETDVRLKKRILRTLIHEIVVDVDADAGEIILTLHWKEVCTPSYDYPGVVADRIAARQPRRSLEP
jgi:hypothetical protein